MIILLLFVAFTILAIASLAGPLYLLLRKTTYGRYPVELSLALFPASIVLTGSLLGHVHAKNFHPTWILPALMAGVFTTAWVLYSHRDRLGAAARSNGPRIAMLLVLAILAGLVVVPRQLAEGKLGYLEFMNGEFLNYSQLAVFSQGHQQSDLPTAFLTQHQTARDGTDFLNVALARLARAEPVDIVQLTSALLRLSYCSLCLLVIWEIRTRTLGGSLLSAVLLLGFVFWNFDIYAFQISFMAANAASGVFVLLVVMLATAKYIPPVPFLCLSCLGNLFLLVTYPEIMPFLKICELAYFLERAISRTKEHVRWTLPLANLCVFLINPTLVLRKIRFVYDLLQANAGWNFLGSPIDDAPVYIQRIFGLRYNFVPSQPMIAPLPTLAVLLVGLALLGWGCGCLSRRAHTKIIWLVPAGLLWFHLAPLMGPPDAAPRQFYGAAKFTLLWAWLAPLSVAAALPWIRSRAGLMIMTVLLGALLTCNLAVQWKAVAFALRLPTFYSQPMRKNFLDRIKNRSSRVAIASEQTIPLWYWFQVLDAAGLRPIVLSQMQANLIARAPSAPFSPPTLPSPYGEMITLVQPTKLLWFSRLDIIEVEDSTERFNKMTSANLTVRAGKLLLAAPQVDLHEADLMDRTTAN